MTTRGQTIPEAGLVAVRRAEKDKNAGHSSDLVGCTDFFTHVVQTKMRLLLMTCIAILP